MPYEREARSVFESYQRDLEHEPEHWGMRLFTHDGGLIWRNRAQRDYYARHGIAPMATLPWRGVCAFFAPEELQRLEHAYARAFERQRPVRFKHTWHSGLSRHTCESKLLPAFGNLSHGVILAVTRPLTAWLLVWCGC
jgi:hypothetical protein